MKFSNKLAVTTLALSGLMISNAAQASILTGSLTVDDIQTTYLSTDNISDGALISHDETWNSLSGIGSNSLVAGVTYYLHVFGENVDNGVAHNPQGFLGEFFLDNNMTHEFATGGITATSSDFTYGNSSWNEGLTIANAQKADGSNRNVTLGISTDQWVWADYAAEGYGANDLTTANFTLEITPTTVVPVPGAVWLFGTGLLGFVGMRKKKA